MVSGARLSRIGLGLGLAVLVTLAHVAGIQSAEVLAIQRPRNANVRKTGKFSQPA
jgi:hypothetical protein